MVNPIKIWPRTGSTTVCTPPNFGNSKMFPVRNTTPQMPPIQIHAGSFSNCAKGICSPCPVTSNNADRNNSPTRNDTKAALKGEPTFFSQPRIYARLYGQANTCQKSENNGHNLILRRRNAVRGRALPAWRSCRIRYQQHSAPASEYKYPDERSFRRRTPTLAGVLPSFFTAILSTFKNNFLQHAASCFLMRLSCAKM